ncbi:hypothetical protein CRM22_005830 [Opisthorchis felineus]|uniref:PDZ domain-containing protein n=1 Tax=Opisthorchis felineus TaxID=147828 RepID=A0A4S2LWJ1_OPIFE|nr:hypothetical protein CRM22_005830 [Opisthorchis felineus]
MTEQPEERVRGGDALETGPKSDVIFFTAEILTTCSSVLFCQRSLLVSQLSQQKRGSYSDDDLFDEELDKDSEQPEPERPVVPTKLPRITPSVSLSVVPSTNTLSSTSGISLDSNPVLKSLVLAPTPSVCATTSLTRRIGSAPLKILPRGQPDLGWRAGRLESILLNNRPASTQLPLGLCLPKRGRPRGRPPKPQTESTPEAPLKRKVAEPEVDKAQRVCPSIPKKPRRPENQQKNPPLLLPLRESHPLTNMALPPLDIAAQFDVFAAVDNEKKPSGADEGSQTPTANSGLPTSASSTSLSAIPGRMKTSSTGDDVDIQALRNYRRLNGYSLFVFMNRRKYESNVGTDEATDLGDSQKDNCKWQAIWSTLSEKERREWKAKARKIMRQNQQPMKREEQDGKDRRWSERRRLERQLARNDMAFATNSLLDLAAHFQLLSDAFAGCASQLEEVEGPVSPQGVESLLLDGLLACLIPLLALASEEEALSSVLDKEHDTSHLYKVTSAGEMAPDALTVAQIQLKARIGDLSSRKASLEREIQTFSEVLQANGNVGLHAPLVDREGFPRSDIDLVAVRVARNNIIRLNNDHKQVMNELEGCLHHLHELARQAGPAPQTEVKEEPKIQSTTTAKAPQLRAFLVVEEVQPGGVAESVGLEVGDRITQFGSVSAENFERLSDISTVMHNTPPNIPILLTVIKPSKDNSLYELELKKPSGGIGLGN